MGKKFKFAAITLLLLFSLCLSACDAVKPIRATFPLSGESLTLVVPSRDIKDLEVDSCGISKFRSDLSLEELHAFFRNSRDSFSYTVNGSVLMISRTPGSRGWYCLTQTGSSQFIFGPASADIIVDIDSSGTRSTRTVIFPVHLLSDSRMRMSVPPFSAYPGTAYEICAGIDVVYDFYQKGGWYNVEKSEDSLVISGYQEDLAAQCRQTIDSDVRLNFDVPVTLHFGVQDGKKYVAFQV